MRKYGVQYIDRQSEGISKINEGKNESLEVLKINELLKKFQAGYTERNLEKADEFVEELFVNSEDTYILGTATGEFCMGIEGVRSLIKGDWEYWGDVKIDLDNADISVEGDVAWFALKGSVRYSFEDTPDRYDRYVDSMMERAEDTSLSPKQRITYINWLLALTYHQREGKHREYLWPMYLSGVLLKNGETWRIAHLKFSLPSSNYPDERFESSVEYQDSYNNQKTALVDYRKNKIKDDLKDFLRDFGDECFKKGEISKDTLNKFFRDNTNPLIIGPENISYRGMDGVAEFLNNPKDLTLSLDVDNAIASSSNDITWVTVTGILKQEITEKEAAETALEELKKLAKSQISSQEKLFYAHRSIAYALKESSIGKSYTCPIRLAAVIENKGGEFAFRQMHFSYPFYWILEGKL